MSYTPPKHDPLTLRYLVQFALLVAGFLLALGGLCFAQEGLPVVQRNGQLVYSPQRSFENVTSYALYLPAQASLFSPLCTDSNGSITVTGCQSQTAASIAAKIQAQTGCNTAGNFWVPFTNTCIPGAGGVSTATQISKLLVSQAISQPTAQAFGSSFIAGNGPINAAGFADPNLAWANVTGAYLGVQVGGYGTGGDTAADIAFKVYQKATPGSNNIYLADTGGTNDVAQYSNNASWLLVYQRAVQAMDYYLLIPQVNKNLLQGCTASGGFVAGAQFRVGMGETSSANGATLTCPITTDATGTAYFAYDLVNGSAATFTVGVNLGAGYVLQQDPLRSSTSWIANCDTGTCSTANSGTGVVFPAGARLTGLAASTAGTIQFTQTAAGALTLEWMAAHQAVSASSPILVQEDVLQVGYAPGLTYSGLYETVAQSVATQLTGDGFNYAQMPARAALGVSTSSCFAGDQVHPSTLGSGNNGSGGACGGGISYLASLAFATFGRVQQGPISLGSQTQVLSTPTSVDVSSFSTSNPNASVSTTAGAAFGGGFTHFFYGGGGVFEGDVYIGTGTNLGSTHVFGSIGNNIGYAFCNWSPGTYKYSYLIAASAPTNGCAMAFNGGASAKIGIDVNGNAALLTGPNGVYVGYYGTVTAWNHWAPFSMVPFQGNGTRNPTINYSSPIFTFGAANNSASGSAYAGYARQIQIPSTGNNQPWVEMYSQVGGVPGTINELGTSGTPAVTTHITNISQPNLLLPNTLYSAAGTVLPACALASRGEQAVVSDATAPTYMGAYASGGGITAAAICSYNGTAYSWLTH